MSGFDNQTMFANNVDFTGSSNVQPRVTTNGQLLIGSTASPNIQVGTLTSPDGSVTIGYSSPNITLKAAGGGGSGDVTGPGSSTNGDIVTFSGTTGKIIQDSGVAFPIPPASGGTGLTSPTAHSLLITEGASNMNLLGAGTTGQILQTNTTADPTWSTSTYPSTNALGDLIYGSASNVLSTLPIATIPGQYLNYNGTNVNWFNPRQETFMSDDWIAQNTQSSLNWRTSNTGTGAGFATNAAVDSGHPGTTQLSTGTTTTGTSFISLGPNSSSQCIILGGGALTIIWILKIDTLSNSTDTYQVVAGIGANQSAGNFNNGVFFNYNDPGGGSPVPNWQIVTAKAASITTADSGIAASTNFVTLQMTINAAGTSASFFINGVQTSNSPIATTIPIVAISPMCWIIKSAGTTARVINVDYFSLYQKLTSNR